MAEWIGIIHSTAPKYLSGAADNTIRNRLILTLVRQKGRITFNESSHECNWDVEYAEQPVSAYGDGGTIDFSRHDLLRQLKIDWRGYKATDMMTEMERLENKGDIAIVKRYDRIMPTLTKSLRNKFCGEFFIDGYATGNENRLHGLESLDDLGVETLECCRTLLSATDTLKFARRGGEPISSTSWITT